MDVEHLTREIAKPIFIIGPGRSGSTLLLRLMSLHHDLAWFSGWTNRFPQWPQLALLSRLNEFQIMEQATRNLPKWPRPAEAYGIWNYCFPGFSSAVSERDRTYMHLNGASRLQWVIREHLRWQGKKRFITKYTGWPRISFLRSIFTDALFVNIERDPRAVMVSYWKQKWGFKSNPELLQRMTRIEQLEIYSRRYIGYFEATQQYVEGQDYIQVYYESLIENPSALLTTICDRVSLPFREAFHQQIKSWNVRRNANVVWKTMLSADEHIYLASQLEVPLKQLGYR